MFIKKDLRKIEQIFTDETDSRESLKLSKRPSEFQGKIGLYFMYSIIYLTSTHSYPLKGVIEELSDTPDETMIM